MSTGRARRERKIESRTWRQRYYRAASGAGRRMAPAALPSLATTAADVMVNVQCRMSNAECPCGEVPRTVLYCTVLYCLPSRLSRATTSQHQHRTSIEPAGSAHPLAEPKPVVSTRLQQSNAFNCASSGVLIHLYMADRVRTESHLAKSPSRQARPALSNGDGYPPSAERRLTATHPLRFLNPAGRQNATTSAAYCSPSSSSLLHHFSNPSATALCLPFLLFPASASFCT
jgi:hypothetical protein